MNVSGNEASPGGRHFLEVNVSPVGRRFLEDQLNEALNSSGDWWVLLLKSLLKDCECSKPSS